MVLIILPWISEFFSVTRENFQHKISGASQIMFCFQQNFVLEMTFETFVLL